MKVNLYDQAVLEGVATTFSQTEYIIENGIVSSMTAADVQKTFNHKHAWGYLIYQRNYGRSADESKSRGWQHIALSLCFL